MKLPRATEGLIRDALKEVTVRALVAEQCPDLDATRKALREVWWAVHHATELVNTTEREIRDAALYANEHRSAA